MTSGDIETNPGPRHRGENSVIKLCGRNWVFPHACTADSKPQLDDLQHMKYTTEDGREVDFRLMDQLKPHVVRVAIALRFPGHVITAVERHCDPAYYLLCEWLREANREWDPRPVTWRTLIEALRGANCQDEANKLEKYLIEYNSGDTETWLLYNYYDET